MVVRRVAGVAVGLLVMAVTLAATPPGDTADLKAAFDRAEAARRGGEVLKARTMLMAVVDQATTIGDKAMLQRALSRLADVHVELNDWAAVLDFGQRAYDVLPDPTGRARMSLLLQTGRVYQELRDRDRSRAALLEVETLAKAAGDLRMLCDVYNELGLLTWRVDRNKDDAVRYYDRSIELAEQIGDPRALMRALNTSGNVFRSYDYAEAERRYRAAMVAARRAGIDEDVLLLKNMGIVYRETGRLDEARRSLERAMVLSDQRGTVRTQWQSRMELGTLLTATEPARAAEYFEQTLRMLEGLNNNVLLEGFRAEALGGSILIAQDDPYALYVDLLLANGRERDAFVVAERARARAFLDTLSRAREQIAKALPEAFVKEENAILATLTRTQGDLRAAGADAQTRASLTGEIVRLEQRLSQIRVRLAVEHPSLAHARYPNMAAVDDVQTRLLRDNEVLLEYFVSRKAGTLWAITASGVHVRRLPPQGEIESAVRSFLERVGRPDGDYRADARKLGAMLLPNLSGVIGADARLIVVPHAILSYVPFEALLVDHDQFLLERHPVSYAPSTSSLVFLRQRRASGAEVIAIGNPVMQNSGSDDERGQPISRVAYLKPLTYSGAEVRSVSKVYGSAAHVFEQQAATEAALSGEAVSRAGIIHIATHGLIDEDVPDRSGLALTPAPQSDGILQMREVYNLHLNAALVTLSACQSALGKEVNGEGLIGLSRAFFYAGANAVIASLWNVNDASTEQLMSPFYRSLASGETIDRALRDAKLAMLKSGGRAAHPYYWAAFVVTGNGTAAVPVTPGFAWQTWQIGLVALVVLTGGAVTVRRVRY
jgi:CHAT domain-containing protein/tetratricopeptide (TPR) repeat protein